MLTPISGNTPVSGNSPVQPPSGAAAATHRGRQAAAASAEKPRDAAEISDRGKAAAAKAQAENNVELAVREAARPKAKDAVLAASRLLRAQMTGSAA